MGDASNPLDQLRPITAPDHAINLWPLAPGWWALLVLLLLLATILFLLRPRWQQRKKRKQIRANTRQLLETLYIECAAATDPSRGLQCYLQQSNEIFKRLLHSGAFRSAEISSSGALTGKQWIEFLQEISARKKSPQIAYANLYGDNLYAARCEQNLDGKAVQLQDLHIWAQQMAEILAQEINK